MPSAVVTGGAAGIGRATAAALAASGHTVVAVDWDAEALGRTVSELGPAIVPFVGDVGDPETHERAADAAEAAGRLVAWVNNAGVDAPGGAHEVTAAGIERGIRLLQMSAMYGCAVAVRRMLASGGGGAIVNVASIEGLAAFPRHVVYGAAKAAVIMLAKSIAVDYGAAGIRCNAVCPGAIDTTLGLAHLEGDALVAARAANAAEASALAPIGRIGQAAEVADAIAFLLSDRAAFMTGTTFVIDGGATARCHVGGAQPPTGDRAAGSPKP